MTFDKTEEYFSSLLQQLPKMDASPWPFLCASTMLEYLAKMAGIKYAQFISTYLRIEYSSFRFRNGKSDLPEQMYHVLRCGMAHSFSLTPDTNRYPDGRNESIIIAHAGPHLSAFPISGIQNHFTDAVILVLDDFVVDIQNGLGRLFAKATTDAPLKETIEQHLSKNPPIEQLPLTYSSPTSGSIHQ